MIMTWDDLNMICETFEGMTKIIDLIYFWLDIFFDENDLIFDPFFLFLKLLQHFTLVFLILVLTYLL